MAHSNGKITAPVSFADVNAVLGTSHTDLGWLCEDTHINKFARYKPLRYPKRTPITNTERISVSHGIVIPDVVETQTLDGGAIQDAAANDWGYLQPTGGSAQPYRLTDFANTDNLSGYGYYHGAVPPIQINYPKGGWKYTVGSGSAWFTIYADLDPDDDIINLQAADFTASGLNLNEWKLVAYVDTPYMSQHIFACDDYILSDGDPSGNSIAIPIPTGVGTWTCDIYICMFRYNNTTGKYELLPLPKQGDYNPSLMELHIEDNASESGGGIEGDPFTETYGSPTLNGTYRQLNDFIDGGLGKWAMSSSTGSLYIRMPLTNKSGSQSTVNRVDFQIAFDFGTYLPARMFDADNLSVAVQSISIANNATKSVVLEFDGVFADSPYWNTSNKNSNWSFDLKRNGAYLVGSDMYAFKGVDGFVQR